MTCRILPIRWMLRAVGVLFLSGFAASISHADEPLHIRIDRMIDSANHLPSSPVANDTEFLRRVWIDLVGMPPRPDELLAFVSDASPEKRTAMIDRLLSTPEFVRHMTTYFDVMLMERRRYSAIKQEEWYGWLYESVNANKPWNQLAREILSADGFDPAQRPAARFALDRQSEPNLLTRDIGRIFFGIDMQCAQCHDHPIVDDYKQFDYYGLYSFVAGGYAFTASDKKIYFAEKPGADTTFASVFESDFVQTTYPKLRGDVELVEPVLAPGTEYVQEPDAKHAGALQFSRRAKLAELATSGSNRQFNENIANRLWAAVMGRGLVHPLDLHHSANPATHPELLRLLGEEFAKGGFDVKAFLREIVLTTTYQRAYDSPDNLLTLAAQAPSQLSEISIQLATAKEQAAQAVAASDQADSAWREAKAVADPVLKELRDAKAKAAAAWKKFETVKKPYDVTDGKLTAKRNELSVLSETLKSAEATLEKLPGDAELTKLTDVFRKKSEQATKEVAALEQTLAKQKTSLDAPNAEVATARQEIDAIVAKLAPLEAVVREKLAVFVAARQTMFDAQSQAERLKFREENFAAFAKLTDQQQQSAAAATALSQKESELAGKLAAVAEYAPVLKQTEETLAAAKSEMEQTLAAMKVMQAEVDRRTGVITNLSTAETQTRAALVQLKDDAELLAAAEQFKVKTAKLQTELDEFQKTVTTGAEALAAAEKKFAEAESALAGVRKEWTARETARDEIAREVTALRETAQQSQLVLNKSLADVVEDSANDFQSATLKPLTPEQLACSIMQTTGVYERYQEISKAELDKKETTAKDDPVSYAWKIEQLTYEKLRGSVAAFVNIYGAGEGNPQGDFFASVDQALFAANAPNINKWVAPAANNISDRMIKETDLPKAVDDLYLTLLSRTPNDAERQSVVQYLESRPDEKAACVQELNWALLNSAEFRFNH